MVKLIESASCDGTRRRRNHNSSQLSLSSLLLTVGLILLSAPTAYADLANERHFVPPKVPAVAEDATTGSKTWALLQSPCQPEADGYFGATYGEPMVLQYAVELVWRNNFDNDKDDALDLIRERVMDAVVSDTFPTLCAIPKNRRHNRDLVLALPEQTTTNAAASSWGNSNTSPLLMGKITGFQFGDDLDVDPRSTFAYLSAIGSRIICIK